MPSRRVQLAIVAVIVLLVGAAFAYVLRSNETDDPAPSADRYLDAWADNDTDAMAELVADPPDDFAEQHQAVVDSLGVEKSSYEVTGISTDDDHEAIVTFEATLSLAGIGDWKYDGNLRLVPNEADDDAGHWKVDWSPATIHPKLTKDVTLALTRQRPERAPILDRNGDPLVEARAAVRVGIEPRRMTDRQQVKTALQTYLGVDPATVDAKLDAPGVQPDHFVDIVTVEQARFQEVRPQVYPVPGLLFRDATLRAAPSEGFAQHILGRTGEITAELLDQLGPTYKVGDTVGLTGLEARYETELAGTPSAEIHTVDATGGVIDVLDTIEGTAPVPLKTTLDRQVQLGVETALAGVTKPAGVVVVDGDGNIRAAASRPLDDGFNRALAGQYPPGSTFKVVSTEGLLTSGRITPDTPIDCPETVNAGGRVFKNFEGGQLGTVPFGQAFAESCNTAFVNATADVPGADLVTAAQTFGFNSTYSVGLTTEGGSFPEPEDATDKAAATIGQGRVLASPLHMATVASAVMSGTWEPPTLLPDHPGDSPPRPVTLETPVRDTLAGLMRRVVTEGSGTQAAVPGATVSGKTGTAEFGEGDPLPTHAWFIGFRDDGLALAIVIEGGGVGGRDAAPVAGQIFASFPAG
ncbi:MAG TPA: penicillin-binding transpeptidase domain-containing protein [Acidimicrobiales bacterium]|jgi:cell division protein FtsI/penicillin-binding protein 2|nr:penicillin-binding transpeptidase domain-containing protein [Acidimicrobiales bacterium]